MNAGMEPDESLWEKEDSRFFYPLWREDAIAGRRPAERLRTLYGHAQSVESDVSVTVL